MPAPGELSVPPSPFTAAFGGPPGAPSILTPPGTAAAPHPTGDDLLTALMATPTALGGLVAAYPGRAAPDGAGWLDAWFRAHADEVYARLRGVRGPAAAGPQGTASDSADDIGLMLPTGVLHALAAAPTPVATQHVRLLTLQPNYFRGFRALDGPVSVGGRLVVLFGPNSGGKTSLAEALEWLFTGALARRATNELGNARELERCVGNQFCPAGQQTWVEATFTLSPAVAASNTPADGSPAGPVAGTVPEVRITLRRVLVSDYGATQTSTCVSTLSRDGVALSPADERALLATLFGGVPPLLMQHTLRSFVQSTPAARRGYFEQLLRLDELTHLIEKAVVTAARLPEFPPPTGGVAHRRWTALKAAAPAAGSRAAFRVAERARGEAVEGAVGVGLMAVAAAEFSSLVLHGTEPDVAVRAVEEEQRRVRQQQFPFLARLRPKRAVDESAAAALSPDACVRGGTAYLAAVAMSTAARAAATDISESQRVIAQAFAMLTGKGLIDAGANVQVCPVCAQDAPPSLTADRLRTVSSWAPVAEAVSRAEQRVTSAADELRRALRAALETARELLPAAPPVAEWEPALVGVAESIATAAEATRAILDDADVAAARARIIALGVALKTAPLAAETAASVPAAMGAMVPDLATLLAAGSRYNGAIAALERAVGTQTTGDPTYALRAQWLEAAADVEATASELHWEHAKVRAQKTLEAAREALKGARQHLLEARRVAFSDGMASVWATLRKDTYSTFKGLAIPEPTARGFPVEIQVKATLDANGVTAEVDALRVFSESQVNVLGIAAFLTRAKLLGHRMVIFDDPVQSMDEDHFRTFARGLLQHLLAEGFQVVVLTHNERFEKDLSFVHADLDDYVTLTVSNSKRRGCHVEEGNRRVQERLDRADRRASDGKMQQAWLDVRLALERLYTIVRDKHGPPDFDVRKWDNHSGETMWEEGVGALVLARVPGAGPWLKDILDLTAAGAHDKPARGETDLREATAYIRGLLTPLKVGG
jgi:hypothetical protein